MKEKKICEIQLKIWIKCQCKCEYEIVRFFFLFLDLFYAENFANSLENCGWMDKQLSKTFNTCFVWRTFGMWSGELTFLYFGCVCSAKHKSMLTHIEIDKTKARIQWVHSLERHAQKALLTKASRKFKQALNAIKIGIYVSFVLLQWQIKNKW